MASTSGIGFSVQLVAGIAFAGIVGLGAYFLYDQTLDGNTPARVQTPDQTTVTSVSQTAPDVPAVPKPKFDVVRVESDGSSVIAGDAPAGADVSIMLGGAEVGRATADAQGKFVGLLSKRVLVGNRD